MRVTAGDFLTAAGDALRRARLYPDPPTQADGLYDVIRALGRVAVVLTRYLDDLTPIRDAISIPPQISGWPLAAIEARQALGNATEALGPGGRLQADPPPPTAPVAGHLISAAAYFSAARDLLHTHLTPASRGGPYKSEWAPVITSQAISRALGAEVAAAASQMAPLAVSLAQAASPHGKGTDVARRRLYRAGRALAAAAEAIERAHRREPARTCDQDLLYAVPASSPPPRILPVPGTSPAALKSGVISTAERVRHATWQPRQAWAPDVTDLSLRHTAAAAVVASHNCGALLEVIVPQASRCGLGHATASLSEAAAASAATRTGWLAVARAWAGQVVTDDSGEPSRVCAAATDLAWWTGRLLYADPGWTPAHGRNSELRPAVELALDAGSLGETVAAIHHVADTLSRLAEAELTQVGQVARARRLYARTRPTADDSVTARPFGPAPPDRVAALTDTYRGAVESSARLATSMDVAARAALAPSLILAAARSAAGRSGLPAAGQRLALASGPVTALLHEMGVSLPGLLAQASDLDRQIRAASGLQPRLPGLGRAGRDRGADWEALL